MSNVAQRILDAIHGDDASIVALASAVAKNDLDAVSDLLRARGVSLTHEEVSSVVAGATGGVGGACTCTCTCT